MNSQSPYTIESYDDVEKKKAAYALNLCAVSVSQIIDYNDVYIMEQEYDSILNNLNLQNYIKDDALLDILKQIMDTVTFFKIQEGDKQLVEKEYQSKMKNAIWAAVPNFGVLLAGGTPLQTAITMAMQVGIGYMNYRRNKNQYLLDKEKQEWELHRNAIEQFHGLRQQLFVTAWQLSDKYDFNDALRLTAKDIAHYNNILLDPDPLKRFERLESISDKFEAFPPYWFYKGNAAREISRKNTYGIDPDEYRIKAIQSYNKFDEIHVGFMREDILASSCALEHISLLDPVTNLDEITKLLEKAMNYAGSNLDVLQICVPISLLINQNEKAESILRRLVNEEYNLKVNGILLSRMFRMNGQKKDFDILANRIGESFTLPWYKDEEEANGSELLLREGNLFVQEGRHIGDTENLLDWAPIDDTKEQYEDIRKTIMKYAPEMYSAAQDDALSKIPVISSGLDNLKKTIDIRSMKSFLEKNAISIDRDTIIVFLKQRFNATDDEGLLFTSYAFYYRGTKSKSVIRVPYSQIEYPNCKLQLDKKGHPSLICIPWIAHGTKKANKLSIEEQYIQEDVMLSMLNELGTIPHYPVTDSPVALSSMDSITKILYLKILINFLFNCGHSCSEIIRLASDLGLDDSALLDIIEYTRNPNEPELWLLRQLDDNSPYASKKSLFHALVMDLFCQLQLATKSSGIATKEYEFIKGITTKYGVSDNDFANLATLAQTKYKIVSGEIKGQKELNYFKQALLAQAETNNNSVASIIGSSKQLLDNPVLHCVQISGKTIFPTRGFANADNANPRTPQPRADFLLLRRKLIESEKASYNEILNKLTSDENTIFDKHDLIPDIQTLSDNRKKLLR